MTNTSATGGPLLPNTSPTPIEDAALVNFFSAYVVGVTGLDPTLVRPRWQANPPTPPDIATSWCAVGIQSRKANKFPYVQHQHDSSGNANDTLRTHEELDVSCSFYGPAADSNSALVRDALQVSQNREALQINGLDVIEAGDATAVPSLINTQWYYRVDVTLRFRREIVRTYPVLDVASLAGTLLNDASAPTLPL